MKYRNRNGKIWKDTVFHTEKTCISSAEQSDKEETTFDYWKINGWFWAWLTYILLSLLVDLFYFYEVIETLGI